jgi:excisionase family DNA binding protein
MSDSKQAIREAVEMPEGIEPALTIPQLCTALSCAPATVYKHLASGALRSFTVGRSRRVTAQALREFIATREAR